MILKFNYSTLKGQVFILAFLFLSAAHVYGDESKDTIKVSLVENNQVLFNDNPETWLNQSYQNLNDLYVNFEQYELDSTELLIFLKKKQVEIALLRNNFRNINRSINIRSIIDMKMEVAAIFAEINTWQKKVHTTNDKLVRKIQEIELIKKGIVEFKSSTDTVLSETFKESVDILYQRQQTNEKRISATLKKNISLENQVYEFNSEVFVFYNEVLAVLQKKESLLFNRELPGIWKSGPGIYSANIITVVADSFMQTLASLKFYGETSLWRIIIFRLLVFIICLIPIRLFRNEMRKKDIMSQTHLKFLDKNPKTSSLIMGLAVAPFIFIHPVPAFLDFIFIGLTVSVSFFVWELYPKIDKRIFIIIIGSYLLLYLINFFVTPTFFGRLVYSLVILLLIPIFKIYKQLPGYKLELPGTVRLFIFFLGIHIVIGWFFVIWGNYTLGKSIILAAYGILIISMIFRIAIYTFLDYIMIIIYFVNKFGKTVQINSEYIYSKIKSFLIFLTYIFLSIFYLTELNLFDLLVSNFQDFFQERRMIGNISYSIQSIVLFFVFVYLSFIIADLLRQSFVPKININAEDKKNNLGGFLLLFRLLIFIIGFVFAIMVSGIPLTSFTIFLGAIGVGVGFGLQNLVSNLISGLVIAFERPFLVGDVLELEAESGIVKEIGLRATLVSTYDGSEILVPNSHLVSNKLKNWTLSGKQRFLELKIQTTHDAVPDKVIEVIKECFSGHNKVSSSESRVLFSEITDYAYVFTIRLLITDLSVGRQIKSDFLLKISEELKKNKIKYPERKISLEK